jgi:putative ABC transport system permease protein
MSLRRILQVAWEGLTLNRGRSLLTTLGVIIGVAAVIIMLAVSAGAEAEIADQVNALGPNLVYVFPGSKAGYTDGSGGKISLHYDDIAAIAENVSGINGVAAEQSTTRDIVGANTLRDIPVVGTTAGFPQVRDYQVEQGRFLSDEDNDRANKVAVLGYEIAGELFDDRTVAVGQKIRIGTTQFTVVGVMEKKGVVGDTNYDRRIYVPLLRYYRTFEYKGFGTNEVWLIYVSASDRDQVSNVIAQVTNLLAARHGTDPNAPGFSLLTQDRIIEVEASTTEAFRNLLAWVAAISLIVGGIGIMNIMLVSVTERTREIGLRQALGARPRDVRLQFLLEAVVLSLVGGMAGVLLGVGGTYAVDALGNMRTELVLGSIPLAFAAAAAVGIFFGYYPANKAAMMDPIDALRRE